MLPSLVAHAVRYETNVGAHTTVDVHMHVVGFTVFAWYGKVAPTTLLDKCQRPQHYFGSDTPGRLHSTRLAWPGGIIL